MAWRFLERSLLTAVAKTSDCSLQTTTFSVWFWKAHWLDEVCELHALTHSKNCYIGVATIRVSIDIVVLVNEGFGNVSTDPVCACAVREVVTTGQHEHAFHVSVVRTMGRYGELW
jgi:hypothetical protein